MNKTDKEKNKEELLKLMEQHPDTVARMGGERAARKQPELFKALVTYGTPEEGLKIFRTETEGRGNGGITKPMIPIVVNYGTVKDKMTLLLLSRPDRMRDKQKPLISKREFDKIRDDMYKSGYGEEMMAYLNAYSAMRKVEDNINYAKACYALHGEKASQYLVTFLWLQRAEALFNSLQHNEDIFNELYLDYESMGGKNKAWILDNYTPTKKLMEDYERDMMENSQWGAAWDDKSAESPIPFQDADKKKVWGYFFVCCNIAKKRLSEYKGALEAVKEWAEQYNAVSLMPTRLKTIIDFALFDTTIDAIPDRFCHNYIKRMEEAGESLSPEERAQAIYPDFEEVGADQETKEYIKQRINEIFDGEG